MSVPFYGSSESLVLLATAVSLQLAQGKDADTLAVLSAFFSVLGDNLALYALKLPEQSSRSSSEEVREGSPLTPP